MQVVEDHQQVTLLRSLDDRACDRLPGPEPGAVVLGAHGGGHGREVVAEPGQHAGPGVERRRALVLRAATGHDHHPHPPRSGGELGAEPALADARVAGDDGEGGPVAGLVEQPDERGELVVPADQWPGRLAGPARSGGRRCGSFRDGVRLAHRLVPLQGWVLLQHGGLQCAQLRSGLETELVGQQVPHLTQHLERVGLPARPGQGQGAKTPQPFTQRVRRREHLELAGHHRVAPQAERRHGSVLERDRPELVEAGPLGLRGRSVLELGVRHPAPERQGGVEVREVGLQVRRGRYGDDPADAEPLVDRADQLLEASSVQGVLTQRQRVAGSLRDEHLRRRPRGPVRLERLAQPGDVPLQRGGHRRRRRITPEQVDQRVRSNRTARVQREGGDQGALLAWAEVDRCPVEADLGGSQDSDAHQRRICAGARRVPKVGQTRWVSSSWRGRRSSSACTCRPSPWSPPPRHCPGPPTCPARSGCAAEPWPVPRRRRRGWWPSPSCRCRSGSCRCTRGTRRSSPAFSAG